MRGEIHFYSSLSALPSIRKWFPDFFGGGGVLSEGSEATHDGDRKLQKSNGLDESTEPLSILTLECVPGVPLTSLFHHNLMEPYHITMLLAAVEAIHSCRDITLEQVINSLPCSPEVMLRSHYLGKLATRFSDKQAYEGLQGGDARVAFVQKAIFDRLEKYTATSPKLAPVIHGDCWFANILLMPDNALKFIDMRGQLDGVLTTLGDPLYDYGKIAQSLLGFDTIVFGLLPVSHEYRLNLVESFTEHLRGVSLYLPPKVLTVAISLIAGVLPFYDNKTVKCGIWALAEELMEPTLPHTKQLAHAFR